MAWGYAQVNHGPELTGHIARQMVTDHTVADILRQG